MNPRFLVSTVWRRFEAAIHICLGVLLGAAVMGTLWVVASTAPTPAYAADMRREVSGIRSQRARAEMELGTVEEKLGEVRKERNALVEKREELTKEVSELEFELAEREAELDSAQKKLAATSTSVKAEEATLERLGGALERLRAQLQLHGTEEDRLLASIAELRAAQLALEKTVGELIDATDEEKSQLIVLLRAELARSEERNERLAEDVRALEELSSEIDTLRSTVSTLTSDLEGAKAQLTAYRRFASDVARFYLEGLIPLPTMKEFIAAYEYEVAKANQMRDSKARAHRLTELEHSWTTVTLVQYQRLVLDAGHDSIWRRAILEAGYDFSELGQVTGLERLEELRNNLDRYRIAPGAVQGVEKDG